MCISFLVYTKATKADFEKTGGKKKNLKGTIKKKNLKNNLRLYRFGNKLLTCNGLNQNESECNIFCLKAHPTQLVPASTHVDQMQFHTRDDVTTP